MMTDDWNPVILVAVNAHSRVGEGPVWDSRCARLHWVDIAAGQIHTSDLPTGRTSTRTVPTLVGAVAPRLAGGFVAATAEGFACVDGDGRFETMLAVLPDGIRMNDGKCDSRGRFWAGSTAMEFIPGQGTLHVLTAEWATHTVLDGLTLPNGLGWSPDDHVFYLVDTMEREISAFDFDPEAGAISNRRTLISFPDGAGIPDGLTVDDAGCLWVAIWGGARIVRISPDGDLLATVPVPVAQPSSCAFAGPLLDLLCVTSARDGLGLTDDDSHADGSVLAITGLGVRGLPSTPFAG